MSKVNVKRFNKSWCPQSYPHSLYNAGKVFCNLAKRSRSKQQVLCTTSSSHLTVETMIEGQMISKFNGKWSQSLMANVKIKWFKELWGPQKCVSDGQTDGRSVLPGPYRCTPGDNYQQLNYFLVYKYTH